jgi:plasmid stabilization system protein ParE
VDSKKQQVKVNITVEARLDLQEIWHWNASDGGVRHADSYLAFLHTHIYGLSKNHTKGRPVSTRPDFRYIIMKRRARGHGHVAIYEIIGGAVSILHVYHTAQDWQTKVAEE